MIEGTDPYLWLPDPDPAGPVPIRRIRIRNTGESNINSVAGRECGGTRRIISTSIACWRA